MGKLAKKIAERTKFEEDNMTRVRLSKKDKSDMKRLKHTKTANGSCVALTDVLKDVNTNFGANRFSDLKKAKEKLSSIKGAPGRDNHTGVKKSKGKGKGGKRR